MWKGLHQQDIHRGQLLPATPPPTHRLSFCWDQWQYNQAGWDHNDQFLLPPHTSLTLGIQAVWDPAATFLYSTCRLPIHQCGTFLVEQWWLIGGAVVAHWLEQWWLIGSDTSNLPSLQ